MANFSTNFGLGVNGDQVTGEYCALDNTSTLSVLATDENGGAGDKGNYLSIKGSVKLKFIESSWPVNYFGHYGRFEDGSIIEFVVDGHRYQLNYTILNILVIWNKCKRTGC